METKPNWENMMISFLMQRIRLHGKKSGYFGTYLEWARKSFNSYCKEIKEKEYFKEHLIPCVIDEWKASVLSASLLFRE